MSSSTNVDGLTVRQRKLAQGVAEGKTITAAGREAGYADRKTASAALAKDDVQRHLRSLMAAQGLTDDGFVERLKRNLDMRKSGITRDGEVVDLGWDGAVQVKALELTAKLLDILPDRIDIDVNVTGAIVVSQRDELAPRPWEQAAPIDAEYTVIPE